MIANRELNIDDYLAIVRRHLPLISLVAFCTTIVGFVVSFFLPPQYTSRSLVLVERQTIPAGYVRPIVTTSLVDRIATLQQQVLSRGRLEQLVDRLGLAKSGKSVEEAIDNIRRNVSFSEADPYSSSSISFRRSTDVNAFRRSADVIGFYVGFTTDNPQDAQRICSEITSIVLAENSKMREQVALNTTDFLARQLAEAKSNLDQKDQEFAEFKSRYLGQLPGDVENNLRILAGLNSELEANTQALSRAQQDKSYAQTLLDQQIAAWKSSQFSQTSDTISQRLVALRTQLVTLQTRYTDDYPDVIKMKDDIAALEAKQKEMEESGPENIGSETKKGRAEPPGIVGLRERIHQNEALIEHAALKEKRLQGMIDSYQGRLTLSPKVEEQYKQLIRDNEVARRFYDTLLANKSESEIQTDLERRQQGEQLRLLDPANLPNAPSFPVRWKFAGGGLVAGLALGASVVFWLELRDRAIRDERDVLAALELPMLASVPWVEGVASERQKRGRGNLQTLRGA